MAIGDGIRRNVATISQAERDRLRNALLALHTSRHFPGSRSDSPPGGVSFWFKQDEIHQATHVHGGPAFLPWHRELCNRFEFLLREVDPDLSLHYWDWTTDPHPLFTNTFMGSANGDAGAPWLAAGFYDPDADPYRSDFINLTDNPYDPPRTLSRGLPAGGPVAGGPGWPTDADILGAMTYPAMRLLLEDAHDQIHGYIGGTIGNPHTSFRDPFVFLLHSNVDRLFAMWQSDPAHPWRLDPAQVYGSETGTFGVNGIQPVMEPWAGVTPAANGLLTRPWAPPENRQESKNCQDPSVVAPRCYDTMPNVPATIVQETASLTFNEVPVNEKTVRAAVFSVYACGDVTFTVVDGPKRLTGPLTTQFELPLGPSVTVHQSADYTLPKARVWIAFTGTAAGDTATGEVTIRCVETGDDYVIPISTSTVARQRALVGLVLDRSNSMNFDAGDGRTRVQVLRDSALPFVNVLQENNAVGMVAFDHDPHDVLPVTVVGAPDDAFDPGRNDARQAVTNHTPNPMGNTAIGDGVEHAHNLLDPASASDFPTKAMIVLTDGQETASKYISEVLPIINPNHRIYAIGLGTPEEIQPHALAALAQGHRGTLQMTGTIDQDDLFKLTKFYLQILANITNEDIVEDPDGFILPGQVHRVPFLLNEADIGSDVLLLSPAPQAIRFTLETPNGDVIDPGLGGVVGTTFVSQTQVAYYRILLPTVVGGNPAQDGLWHAVLEIDRAGLRKYISSLDNQQEAIGQVLAHGVRYSLNVHAYSNLRMRPTLTQDSYQPGATLTLRAILTEYDLPVEARAGLAVTVERPDSTVAVLPLAEVEPGVFEASFPANQAGIYACRLRANGHTLRGRAFTREALLTGLTWRNGDTPPVITPGDTSTGTPGTPDNPFVDLICCLNEAGTLKEYLAQHGIDPDAFTRCLRPICR